MRNITAIAALTLTVVACSDGTSAPIGASPSISDGSEGRGAFQRYVAMGTSVSMGWQSDGAVGKDQATAWPAQLARLASRDMTLPLIADPGCRAPIKAPLALGVRTTGESLTTPAGSLICAPLATNSAIPSQNVAIAGATTKDALTLTPEAVADPFYSKLYPKIIASGTTQLSAAVAQNPKIVSVELGANEVFSARSGIAIEGVTIFPVAQFKSLYTVLSDSIAKVTKYGVLVGLIDDVGSFPSFRRGAELYADRATFLAGFHVVVSDDCNESDNLIFVPVVVPTAVATGAALKGRGLPPYTLSCSDKGLGVQDYVLTPAEAGVVNAKMAEMDSFIEARAAQLRFAHFRLNALYGRQGLKPAFSVVQLMTSAQPYGALISLDGIHPSAEGHAVLAAAAARSLDARYQFGMSEGSAFIAAR